jgi:hypothetical protein
VELVFAEACLRWTSGAWSSVNKACLSLVPMWKISGRSLLLSECKGQEGTEQADESMGQEGREQNRQVKSQTRRGGGSRDVTVLRYEVVAFARGEEEWPGMGGLAALGAGQGALGAAEAERAGRCIRERKCAGQDARGAAGVTRVQRERDNGLCCAVARTAVRMIRHGRQRLLEASEASQPRARERATGADRPSAIVLEA